MNTLLRLIGIILCGVLGLGASRADARPRAFAAQGGEAVFKSICQGCHMPDAKGAVGAGAYPALAANPNLEAAGYPLMLVVGGRKAMPAFGNLLTDQQVADVVNYVRTSFGNRYSDAVTPDDVEQIRAVLREPN
jgi:mono/diheme cytochrome c family protein